MQVGYYVSCAADNLCDKGTTVRLQLYKDNILRQEALFKLCEKLLDSTCK